MLHMLGGGDSLDMILNAVKADPGIQGLMPYFIQFVAETVKPDGNHRFPPWPDTAIHPLDSVKPQTCIIVGPEIAKVGFDSLELAAVSACAV